MGGGGGPNQPQAQRNEMCLCACRWGESKQKCNSPRRIDEMRLETLLTETALVRDSIGRIRLLFL